MGDNYRRIGLGRGREKGFRVFPVKKVRGPSCRMAV